ncbi:unnamed protein product [Eretmochelys imbricata]
MTVFWCLGTNGRPNWWGRGRGEESPPLAQVGAGPGCPGSSRGSSVRAAEREGAGLEEGSCREQYFTCSPSGLALSRLFIWNYDGIGECIDYPPSGNCQRFRNLERSGSWRLLAAHKKLKRLSYFPVAGLVSYASWCEMLLTYKPLVQETLKRETAL